MTAEIVNGRKIAEGIRKKISEEVKKLEAKYKKLNTKLYQILQLLKSVMILPLDFI